jgi:Mg2+ and Co2+ transporter CorA
MLTFENIMQIRFMESRAYELNMIMEEVRSDIDIAIEKYGCIIDYTNTSNSNKLNDIMTAFTLISVSCLPATLVGGLFGMNVKVPYQADDDSTVSAFLVLIGIITFCTLAFLLYFKY